MLSKRYQQLLAGLVEEYIRTARPVSSAHLVTNLGLNVSAATVRSALHELEEAGFIQQPHTSAGRIPTDQGYRYYVDNLRDQRLTAKEQLSIEEHFKRLREEHQHMSRSVAKLLSLLSHSVVLTGIPEAKELQLAGLKQLLSQPEGDSVEALREVSDVVEALDEYLHNFETATRRGPQVFIGEEIPFVQAKHTSVILQGAHPEEQQQMMLVIVGPKRMAYRRNVQLLNAVSDIIEGVQE